MGLSRGQLLFKHKCLLPFIQALLCQNFVLKDQGQVQIKFKAWLCKMWVSLDKHLTSELPSSIHLFMHLLFAKYPGTR